MDIKSEGQALLENHKKLYEQLIEIPEKREMIYIEEIEESVKVGKPRFKKPLYQWSKSLLVEVRDHLQDIRNFFDNYSYWFDDTLIPLLDTNERRVSKKSIIFLLEEDVWCTDEVYGKYLIEESQDGIIISYSRRKRKINQITLKPMSKMTGQSEFIDSNLGKTNSDLRKKLRSYLKRTVRKMNLATYNTSTYDWVKILE